MVIGPRIWKTGISVALCIFLVQSLNLESPLLAVVAAIITIQPSITKSIVHGSNRAIATLIGGLIGLVIVMLFGAHPIIIGLAVILAIAISIKLKLQEAIVITTITVVAVMVDVTGDPKIFAFYRLLETLIGIAVGVGVNLTFSPPDSKKYLVQALVDVNQRLKNLYVSVVNGVVFNQKYDQEKINIEITEIRGQLEDIRRMMFEFKDEIGYKKEQRNHQIKKYEVVVNGFNFIFERILGIYHTEVSRSSRNISVEGSTKEYKDILNTLQKLLTTTVSLQDNLLCYLTSKNSDLSKYLENCSAQSNILIKELRSQINHWHLQEENKDKALSLMEISNIGYEMEGISQYLNRISGALKELIEGENEVHQGNMANWFSSKLKKRRKSS